MVHSLLPSRDAQLTLSMCKRAPGPATVTGKPARWKMATSSVVVGSIVWRNVVAVAPDVSFWVPDAVELAFPPHAGIAPRAASKAIEASRGRNGWLFMAGVKQSPCAAPG